MLVIRVISDEGNDPNIPVEVGEDYVAYARLDESPGQFLIAPFPELEIVNPVLTARTVVLELPTNNWGFASYARTFVPDVLRDWPSFFNEMMDGTPEALRVFERLREESGDATTARGASLVARWMDQELSSPTRSISPAAVRLAARLGWIDATGIQKLFPDEDSYALANFTPTDLEVVEARRFWAAQFVRLSQAA